MGYSDTAEYWDDVKRDRNRIKIVYIHLKDAECGHYHVSETENVADITCNACIKMLTPEQEIERERIQKKREKNRQKKERRRFAKAIIKYRDQNPNAPTCICGLPMIERRNRKTYKWFWGCLSYPKCKHTKEG